MFGREGPVLMSNVGCNGSETGLHLCPSNRFGSQPCENGTAGIICNTNFGECLVKLAFSKRCANKPLWMLAHWCIICISVIVQYITFCDHRDMFMIAYLRKLSNILRHLKVYCHCFFSDTHNRCNDENGTPPENWNTLSKTERYLCTRLCWPDRYRMMIINVCLGLVIVSRMLATASSVIRYSEEVLTMYLLRLFTGVRKTYPQLLTVKFHLILKATPWKMVMNVTKTFWEWFVTITWCHVGQSR